MAENTRVVVRRAAGGDSVYSDGRDVRLQDGHPLVFDGEQRDARVVAIWAPGKWLSADVMRGDAS